MRTEEIRFVAEVCRTGSIAGAARNLNITPQGLGKAIQKLENELGVKLFTRTFEGVVPTASCNQIYDRLTKIVNAENEIRQIIQQYRHVGINEEIFLIGSNTVGIYVEEAVNAYNIKYGKNIRILQSPLSDDIQEQAFLENKYAYRYCCLENMKNNTLPNYHHWANTDGWNKVKELVAAAQKETDVEKRNEFGREISDILADELPMYSYVFKSYDYVMSSDLNLVVYKDWTVDFANCSWN